MRDRYDEWNGWYYLIFSNALTARYRMARSPLGPWLCPPVEILDGPLARVMKTAAFHGNRRIGVAWLGTRQGDTNDGPMQWGGHALFRELVQHADGTLGCTFVSELQPPTGQPLFLPCAALTPVLQTGMSPGDSLRLDGGAGLAVVRCGPVPFNLRLSLKMSPAGPQGAFGVRLRSDGDYERALALTVRPSEGIVELGATAIYGVGGLDRPFSLELLLQEDIVDVCIDGRRCVVNRCPDHRGDQIFLFAHGCTVCCDDLSIQPIL